MISPSSEEQLSALVAAIIASKKSAVLSTKKKSMLSKTQLMELRQAVLEGEDPLGVDLIRLRSAEVRRANGAIYTPQGIVEAMVAWAKAESGPTPSRIVDPGSGSGRFLIEAAKVFPNASLVAAEIDPLAAGILRANAVLAGFVDRLTVRLGDYRTLNLPKIDGRTLFIGNPPYVRHHQIPEESKVWFGNTAKHLGFQASKLAGLHIHFFLRTREIAAKGDFGAFITASEWMDVNYGSVLRHMLADGLGGTSLHVFDAAAAPFKETMTTGAITCFRVGNRPEKFKVRTVTSLDQLMPLTQGKPVSWTAVSKTDKWSTLVRRPKRKPSGVVELGELFRVHRGQVTGANAVWIAGPEAAAVPERYLVPTVTRAREILAVQDTLDRADHLRRVVDLPVDLDELTSAERRKVSKFLDWAKSQNAHMSYVASHRRAWWSVGLRVPPPILCTYMARRAPAFVRNNVNAAYINIAHGLYPCEPMSDDILSAVIAYLTKTVVMSSGRTYAGGLVKFEPGEVERLYIPEPSTLTAHV